MAEAELTLRQHIRRLSDIIDRNHGNVMTRLDGLEDAVNALARAFADEPPPRNGEDKHREERH